MTVLGMPKFYFFLMGKTKITSEIKALAIFTSPSRFKFCKVNNLYLHLKDGVYTKLEEKKQTKD